MATTTNFGWTTPDDTALVKDGASAIRTLGSSIDTSMAQLKGGTTGQILSKTSNSDMAFTWIANDQGDITAVTAGTGLTGGGTTGAVTVSLDSPVAATLGGTAQTTYATGDLLFASAANTLSKRTIGSTGQVLTVSSGVPVWSTPAGSTLNAVSVANGTITSGTSLTLSSLSSYDQLFLSLTGLAYSSGGSQVKVTVNGSTASTYFYAGSENRLPATITGIAGQTGTNNGWFFGPNYGWDDANDASGALFINLSNCKSSSGFTTGFAYGAWKHTTTTDRIIFLGNLGFLSNEAISSIKIEWADGNTFTGGTYRLLGA